ncbi:MAG: response regulator [Coleofasciculaceae cyanobacterium]
MYKIALLDDNHEFCQVMECFLDYHFDFQAFTDTNLFLSAVKSSKYDLVLIDFSIVPPRGLNLNNGCELIRHLKSSLLEPPFTVLFTGWLGLNTVEEGRRICAIADGYLAKSSDIENMLEKLDNFLPSQVSH